MGPGSSAEWILLLLSHYCRLYGKARKAEHSGRDLLCHATGPPKPLDRTRKGALSQAWQLDALAVPLDGRKYVQGNGQSVAAIFK
jgi:hypothetical protein